ncbi:glycerol-3-phosphate dehydrogenase [Tamaricihabitans halophyticus]|uniref:Glycerol-3-phosphate dehydrogenase n=1 Tax=Tamaricihabitans halophyticus TaxID=1262583 RepID=A0A4R2R3C0_9PSEU|nr:glycerol-3-phosphate dehydrogenase/oxidase [Tamaricihabitans halophyticus]TCP56517.1 glycerol-3-phosphate dehydrogenase [Tamaricihabitans halophyticus]
MRNFPLPHSSSLNAARRAAELDEIAAGETVDVLVVGGGVTGTGIALDAASRGLSVALVEAEDLAFGTSRWSSKLIHGGLRYLAHGELALAWESAVERHVLLTRTAPHLVRTLPQVIPLEERNARRRGAFLGAGLVAGDLLRRGAGTPSSLLPPPRRISIAEARALVPCLRRADLACALLSFDGALTDDARLVVALARTAAGYGARILTRLRATAVAGDHVTVLDGCTGQQATLRARVVLNAAGVWAGGLTDAVRLHPSRGSHLVLDGVDLGLSTTALTVPIPGERNRFVLLIPQPSGHALLGLTDEPMTGDIPDIADVPDSDVDFLLGVVSTALNRKLTRSDVLGSFAGMRPLLAGSRTRSADLSRKHAIVSAANGVLTVVGGKLTTYRKMAEDAVDAAITAAGLYAGPTRTTRLPLVGAAPRSALSAMDVPERLIAKYGTEATRIAAVAELDAELAKPVAPGTAITGAEIAFAVRHEGALDVADVLERRTRLGLVPSTAAAAAPQVSEITRRALAGLAG